MRVESGNNKEATADLPTVSQLIENYIQALGGAAAIEKVRSRVEHGSTQFRGQPVNVEVFTQQPGKQTVIRHLAGGESIRVFDGHAGWLTSPNQPLREMHDADLAAARMDADLHFPLHIRQMFPDLRIQYAEKVAGRDAYVLLGTQTGRPSAQLYFDKQSALLLRIVRYAESPLGLDPSQIDYSDYRAVDGVEVPFRVTLSDPGSSSIFQVEQVQQNVAIDDAKFVKPVR